MNYPGTVERAFQLAAGFTTIDEIRNALKSEGYSNVDAHLAGPSIRADLKRHFAR
jgi:tRNA G26 N,N-dimethylase Trm1